jgi:hypothetical protein
VEKSVEVGSDQKTPTGVTPATHQPGISASLNREGGWAAVMARFLGNYGRYFGTDSAHD